jgi:hypothetical protein
VFSIEIGFLPSPREGKISPDKSANISNLKDLKVREASPKCDCLKGLPGGFPAGAASYRDATDRVATGDGDFERFSPIGCWPQDFV